MAANPERRKHVVVVDDNPDIHTVYGEYLTTTGYRVSAFANGEQAIGFFLGNASDVDLVLLDLQMPFMHGEECFQRLMLIDPDVKVVIITGNVEDPAILRMIDDGALGCLNKPFSLDELVVAITAAFQNLSLPRTDE